MKFEIKYKWRGQEFTKEVESDNQFQAVAELGHSLRRWNSWQYQNEVEILSVRSVNEHTELVLHNSYITNEGNIVVMQKIHNEGKEYETMSDQHDHHRYSRGAGRIVGRSTGSKVNGPNSVKLGCFWTKGE